MNKLTESLRNNKSYLTSLALSIAAALLIGAVLMPKTPLSIAA